jgi:Mrp family chromosome partitioning ATPase
MGIKEQVLERLKTVMDPELNISIVDLGMVKGIELQAKTLNLTIALTVSGCPLRAKIEGDIDQALQDLEGFEHIHLAFTAMAPEELNALKQRLGAQRAGAINSQPGMPQHHSPEKPDAGGINRLPKKVPNIIAVTSGKGGVGKSSVTSMLATSLQRLGKKVGILDADITGPSIARIFGSSEKPGVKDESVLIPVDTKSGVKILSMNLLIDDEDAPVIWRGPLVNGAIRQLYSDAAWEGLDFLLLDLPPGTSDANLTVFQSIPVDGVVIVTSPQDLVRMIVAKSVGMCKQLRVPIIGLVENLAWVSCPGCDRVILPFGPTRGAAVAKDFGIPFLGSLPIDASLAEACDAGQIDRYESKAFAQVAEKVLESRAKA